MRIAVGQLWQETNTFNRNPSSWDEFAHWGIARGDDILAQYGRTGEIGGFVDQWRTLDPEAEFVGLDRFACWPGGSIAADAWQRIRSRFAESLQRMGRVDAVALALHGALAAEGEPDATGALLEQVRAAVGPDVPIVGTLDLHANITRRMTTNADVLCGYHTCPHLDSAETGARAAKALRRILVAGVRPRTTWRKLPMFTAAERHDTFKGPPAPLYRRLEALEQRPDVLTAGIYMVMPWFDVPDLGWSIVLTTTGEPGGTDAHAVLDELTAACWSVREELEHVERVRPEEIVAAAQRFGGHPVAVGDGSDATNSGSPGDSTHLLRAFLAAESIPHGALLFLVDPEAVQLAAKLGPGAGFDSVVGGCFAPEYSEPVRLRGRVERVLDVDFVLDGHGGKQMPVHMGRGAVVVSGDVTVLLVERPGPGSSPTVYRTAGLEPKDFGIVVARSPAGFRADYGPFSAGILLADCPGCASPDWSRMKFLHVDHPVWPLDPVAGPHDAPWCRRERSGGER